MPVSFLKVRRQFEDIFVTLESSSTASVLTGDRAQGVLGTSLCGELQPCFAGMLRHPPTPTPTLVLRAGAGPHPLTLGFVPVTPAVHTEKTGFVIFFKPVPALPFPLCLGVFKKRF